MNLNYILYRIEGLFIDHGKLQEIHDIKNKVHISQMEAQIKNKQLQKEIKNTTVYKVAVATGGLK